ncbi:MAG: TetR family transcriptional regulator FadR [Chloroflexota bacterium]
MDYVIELGRRERKRQAVHQSLLDAALRLFGQYGISRTTVDDIAEAADVARQTVFNHFPYKEAFALELASATIRDVGQHAHALLEAGSPALEVLQASARRILDSAVDQGECAVVAARELLHSDLERASRAAEKVPLCHLFEAILLQAREEGAIQQHLPLEVVARNMGAVLTSIVAQILHSDPDSLRRDLSVCFDMFLNGITDRRL